MGRWRYPSCPISRCCSATAATASATSVADDADDAAAALAGENVNDLHSFDTNELAWRSLAPAGQPPPPRIEAGFAAVGGRLYLFGGATYNAATNGFGGKPHRPLLAPQNTVPLGHIATTGRATRLARADAVMDEL